MKIPVLAYHSYQAGDPRDILAFEEHLEVAHVEGYRVLPVPDIVRALVQGLALPERVIGLTCDDGKRYDYFLEPQIQRSMLSVLTSFRQRHWFRQRASHLSCFVIADREARLQIGLGDPDLMSSDWWASAATGRLISIQNHSFDHAHQRVRRAAGLPPYNNDFSQIDSVDEADRQIALAARMIDLHLKGNERCCLFAYPFGHANEFLANDYFPHYMNRHGMTGAFTTRPEPMTATTNPWLMPRYVVNCDIRDISDLNSILRDCGRASV